MASITSQLIVELLDKVSGPARTVGTAIGDMNRKIKESSAPAALGDRIASWQTQNDRAIARARGSMIDAIGTFYVLKNAFTAPYEAAQKLETGLAQLGAKGNLTAEQLEEISKAAKQASGTTNQFTADIIAAQDHLVGMGLEVERSTAAMPTIAKAATATGASLTDLSAAGFAAMSNLGVEAEQLGKSFDIMAAAGKAGGFELKDMAQYLPSITALASSKGMTGQNGLSQIASALQIVRRGAGDSAEAATNFNNILQKINSNDAIKKLGERGVDIQKVLKDAAASGADPLEAAIRAVNQAIGGDLSRLGEVFADAQVQKGLIPLLTGLEDYIKLRDEAANADGVVGADFERMMDTGAEKAKSFGIAMQNLQTAIGQGIAPVLNNIAESLKPILEFMAAVVERHPGVTAGLFAIAGGLLALKAATAGLTFIGLLGKGGALSMLSFAVNGLGGSLGKMAGGANEMIRLQGALARMDGKTLGALENVAAAARGMALAAPGASGFVGALSGLGGLLATISAPAWATFALAAAAIGAAGWAIWRYWDRISSVMSGVGAAIGDLLAPALEKVKPYLEWLKPIGNVIASGWERAKSAMSSVASWLGSIFQQETLTEADKEKARQAGYDFVMALWNGMKQVFSDMTSWVGAQIDGLVAKASSLGRRVSGFFGGGSEAVEGVTSDPMGTGVDGQRAKGGPISRGGSYLVGEQGPELITAGRSGYVNKAGSFPAGGITVSPVFNMTFNGKTDSEDVVQQIRRVLRDEVRETFRGVFADTSMRFA